MLLALRDQLNTPVQTLVLGATRLALHDPSRDLSLEIPLESQAAAVADDELRRARDPRA
jgi:hypothetical protein